MAPFSMGCDMLQSQVTRQLLCCLGKTVCNNSPRLSTSLHSAPQTELVL